MFLLLTNQEAVWCDAVHLRHDLKIALAARWWPLTCITLAHDQWCTLLLLYQFDWSVLFIVCVRSSAIQRLINQCVLNYPKILRFSYRLQVGCSDCIFIVSLSLSLSNSSSCFAMQRHSIYLLVAGKTIIIIRAFTLLKTNFFRLAHKAMGFSILLFLLCESKLPPRCNRFSFLFFHYYWEIVIIVFFGFGCIYGGMKWTGKQIEMNVKLMRICIRNSQTDEEKKIWGFSSLVNHKLHFNNE